MLSFIFIFIYSFINGPSNCETSFAHRSLDATYFVIIINEFGCQHKSHKKMDVTHFRTDNLCLATTIRALWLWRRHYDAMNEERGEGVDMFIGSGSEMTTTRELSHENQIIKNCNSHDCWFGVGGSGLTLSGGHLRVTSTVAGSGMAVPPLIPALLYGTGNCLKWKEKKEKINKHARTSHPLNYIIFRKSH